MGMDIYLQWNEFTDADHQRRIDAGDRWADGFAAGQLGHLSGWLWKDLFIEAYRNSETPDRWTAIPGEVLMRKLPTFIAAVTADHAGPADPYWHDYLGLGLGFIHRVVQLEAEGQHPVIRVSW